MARGDYAGSGEAFLGGTSLGPIEWRLFGFENARMRKADGHAEFANGAPDHAAGRPLKIVPDDGNQPFSLVITGMGTGGTRVSSDGEMPWWH